MNSLF